MVDEAIIRAALRAVNVPSVRADASKAVAKPESDRTYAAGMPFEGRGDVESAGRRMSSFDFERARSYRRWAESSWASIWHQEFERRSRFQNLWSDSLITAALQAVHHCKRSDVHAYKESTSSDASISADERTLTTANSSLVASGRLDAVGVAAGAEWVALLVVSAGAGSDDREASCAVQRRETDK